MQNIDECLQNILSDIKVELAEEFDKNFSRGGFFENGGWKRSSRPGAKSTLLDSGTLRRSIRATTHGNAVSFTSHLPYAAIHNNGGTITVTAKMKRFFWAMYIKNGGGKKGGTLGSRATFCKSMALKKEGSKIVMPQRQFIGYHQSLEKPITDIIKSNFTEFLKNNLPNNK